MKSQKLTLLILTIVACLFRSTHQYRLQTRRQITEYHLLDFIVKTCSAEKMDKLLQKLCDETLEATISGGFPLLIDYCEELSFGTRFCKIIHGNINLDQKNDIIERFLPRRFLRSLDQDEKLYRNGQVTSAEKDLEQKIKQMCMTNMLHGSLQTDSFCNQALTDIGKGLYSNIVRLCNSQTNLEYCQRVLSSASSLLWLSNNKSPNPLSSSSIIHTESSSIPLASSKSPNAEPINN